MSKAISAQAPNFTWDEAACPCGCTMPPDVAENVKYQAALLQGMRYRLGAIKPTSWYRCKTYNASVGGASRSWHMTGLATDIKMVDLRKTAHMKILAELIYADGGLGFYNTYPNMIHVDARGKRARWTK